MRDAALPDSGPVLSLKSGESTQGGEGVDEGERETLVCGDVSGTGKCAAPAANAHSLENNTRALGALTFSLRACSVSVRSV